LDTTETFQDDMDAIVEDIREEVNDAKRDFDDVPLELRWDLADQFELLKNVTWVNVTWSTWDYRNVSWPY
jgi:hypothetical protein